MFLYTAISASLLPLIAIATPVGERSSESIAISDVVLEPRQAAVAGIIGAIVGGAVGSNIGAGGSSFPGGPYIGGPGNGGPDIGGPSFPGGPYGYTSGSNNPSPLNEDIPDLPGCIATSSNSNFDTVHPVDPFEVRKVAVLIYPFTTISMDITDRIDPLDPSSCYYNTSCSIQLGLQVAAPSNGSNSSFVTYTDLPQGSFIQCSPDAPHLGINLTAEGDVNDANTTFKVTLIHTVLYESNVNPEVRSASFVIDLNSAAGNASSLSMSRSSNMTTAQPKSNGTSAYAWRQAGDAWYSNATSSAAPAGWIGDAVVDAV